jgi:Ca2+-binding RTX toxin-like protein
VDLHNGTASGGEAAGDVLAGIENLIGSKEADVLTGDSNANVLVGGGGDDQLYGGGGDDILTGDAGDDRLEGGAGIDTASYAQDENGVEVTLGGDAFDGSGGRDTLIDVENLTGSGFDDILTGDDQSNVLDGGAGDDILEGRGGDDVLMGGEGDDLLRGGAGTDTVSYASDVSGVDVTIGGAAADGFGGTDSLSGIENLEGSDFDDVLTGDFRNNTLTGGAGDDLLIGGMGDDELKGGEGIDTVSYAPDPGGVQAALTGPSMDGYGDTDTLTDVENLTGTRYADTLTGADGMNLLDGGAGDDVLDGGADADLLIGGEGDDTLIGGAGDDILLGGVGDDILQGGADRDAAAYLDAEAGVQVDLGQTYQDTAGAGFDTLTGIEDLVGSPHDDVLTGDGGANLLIGGSGDDTLSGGLGDDVLVGGAGADSLDGGGDDPGGTAYFDTASYSGDPGGVDIVLGQSAVDGYGNEETLIGIENLRGSDFNDTLIGDAGGNVIEGRAGEDFIDGRAGGDTLSGGEDADLVRGGDDDDLVEGGLGDDTLIGGDGVDTVSYAGSPDGVEVDLTIVATAQSTRGAGRDSLSGFENITGSPFDDLLTGDDGANILDGGAGDDILIGGPGDDELTGGDGSDTASYEGSATGVTVDLGKVDGLGDPAAQNTGGAGTDTLDGIENLTGSAHPDHLTGDGGDNVLTGGTGDDILTGGGGNDTASYHDAQGGVTVDLSLTSIQDTGSSGSDTLSGIENLIGSRYDDLLAGSSGENVLDGDAGDDILEGGAGDDTLIGGTGSDTASYGSAPDGVDITLGGSAADGYGYADDLTDIENLIGSDYDDILTGDGAANILIGGDGVDELHGAAGDDVLEGGAGNDLMTGGAGIDTVSYAGVMVSSTDPDQKTGVTADLGDPTQQNTVRAGLDTMSEMENLVGSDYDDILTGDGGANVLVGGTGDDRLYGAGGDDLLVGQAGDDTLDGGGGTDTASYIHAPNGVTATLDDGTGKGTASDGYEKLPGLFGTDILLDVQNLIGSGHDDVITGDGGVNILTGGPGDDLLAGGAGHDVLRGDDGDDTLEGGAGSDTVDGGPGRDAASYASDTGGVDVTIGGTATDGYGDADVLKDIEDLIGSAHNDTLTGDTGDNVLEGGGGDDVLTGGGGEDTASYSGVVVAPSDAEPDRGVTVDLGITGSQFTVRAGWDTLAGIENLTGSDYDDSLAGDSGANLLMGGAGADVLEGGGGDDILEGGAGADRLFGYLQFGSPSSDTGSDTASYASDIDGVKVTLGGVAGDGFGDIDTLAGIENLLGSTHDDELRGDSNDNILYGGGGNDTLIGGGGSDIFAGGLGDDSFDYAGGSGSLTITDPDSSLTISTDILLPGNIILRSGGTVTVEAGKTISTRQVGAGDHLTGSSTGDSGNILIEARDIKIDAGARLLAHALDPDPGDSVVPLPGSIYLHAADTPDAELIDQYLGQTPKWIKDILNYFIPVDVEYANVTLDSAVIKGGDVDIVAESGLQKHYGAGAAQFDPARAVDGLTGTIRFDTAHPFKTGDAVAYSSGSGSAVGGLDDGGAYFVVVIDSRTIQLTRTEAEAGSADPDFVALDPSTATGSDHGFVTQTPFLDSAIKFLKEFSLFGTSLLPSFDLLPAAVSIATSTVSVGEGTTIDASTLNLGATAKTGASVSLQYLPLLVGVGYSQPTAKVTVAKDVVINTTGDVAVKSVAESTVDVSAERKGDDLPGKMAEWIWKGLKLEAVDDVLEVIPSLMLAVGIGNAHSTSEILAGSTIVAGGNFSVEALTVKDQKVTAKGDDRFALGVAVSVFTGGADATVGGTVTAAGDVSVKAGLSATADETTAEVTFKPEKEESGSDDDDKGSDDSTEIITEEDELLEQLGIEDDGGPPGELVEADWWDPITGAYFEAPKPTKPGVMDILKKISLSGAVAVEYHGSESTAGIADGAIITSRGGGVDVIAKTSDRPKIKATTKLQVPDGGFAKKDDDKSAKQVGLGGSFLTGVFTNSAKASIGSGAQVNALKQILVQSVVEMPWEQEVVNLDQVTGYFTAGAWEGTGWLSTVPSIIGAVFGIKGYFDLNKLVNTTWSQSSGQSADFGAQGAGNILVAVNTSEAFIAENAKINQDSSLRSYEQDVRVEALINMTVVNLSGILPSSNLIDLINPIGSASGTGGGGLNVLGSVIYNDVTAEIRGGTGIYGESLAVVADTMVVNVGLAPATAKAEKTAIGGALSISALINQTDALIDEDAVILTTDKDIGDTGSTVLVRATDTSVVVNLTGAAALGNTAGTALSGAVNVGVRNTRALIGDPDGQQKGTGSVTSQGEITVEATNTGVVGGSAAGVSGSPQLREKAEKPVETTKKKAEGFVGKVKKGFKVLQTIGKAVETGVKFDIGLITNLNQFLHKGGKKDYIAAQEKIIKDFSKFLEGKKDEKKKEKELSKWGLSLSANASLNVLFDSTQASIQNAAVHGGDDLRLNAQNTTIVGALGGSAGLSPKTSEGSVSMGVSVGTNVVLGRTMAYIDNSDVDLQNDLLITANTFEIIGALAANGAMSKNDKGGAGSLSIAANVVVHDTRAYIMDSTVIDANDIAIRASNMSVAAAVSGSLAYSAGAAAVGPSLAANVVTEGIHAYVIDSSLSGRGDIDVTAWNLGVTGSLAVAGGITRGGIAAPISLSNNTVVTGMSSYIATTDPAATHTVQAAGDINLTAVDTSVTVGVAGSLGIGLRSKGDDDQDGKTRAGNAAGASVSVNTVVGSRESYVDGAVFSLDPSDPSVIDAGGDEIDLGFDHHLITGDAVVYNSGGGENMGDLVNGRTYYVIVVDPTTLKLATTGAQADAGISDVNIETVSDTGTGHSFRRIDNLVLTAGKDIKLESGNVSVLANFAVSGQGADTSALGGSFAVNTAVSITGSALTNASAHAGNDVALRARDVSVIGTAAGAVQVAVNTGSSGSEEKKDSLSGGVGASAAVNVIAGGTHTAITGSEVIAGGTVGLDTDSNAVIAAVAIAGSGAGAAGGDKSGVALAAGGAFSVNAVVTAADASIGSGSSVTTTGTGGVTLDADGGSVIVANALGLSGALASGKEAAGAGSVGPSVAANVIASSVGSNISGASVNSGGAVGITASSTSVIWALTVGGSGAGAGSSDKFGLALSGAGAATVNIVSDTVHASVEEDSSLTSAAGLTITAKDFSLIMADAGGLSGAVAGGKSTSGAGSIGASLAVNVIANDIGSFISDSTVTTGGGVELTALSEATIWALTVGGSGAGAGSSEGTGIALSVGGAVTVNVVSNAVKASIEDSSDVTTATDGMLSLEARDRSLVLANAVGLSGAGAGGKSSGVAASTGASLAVNVIANTVRSFISGSTVTSGGDAELTAGSEAAIWALSVGGSGAGAGGGDQGGFAISGGGAVSVNTVANLVEASIEDDAVTGSILSMVNGGTVTLTSLDDTIVIANAGGLSFAVGGGGKTGAGASFGGSLAVNTIADRTRSLISGSTVRDADAVDLDARRSGPSPSAGPSPPAWEGRPARVSPLPGP